MTRDVPHPDPDLDQISMAQVLHGLADPARLHMVRTLHELGQCPCSLANASLGLSKSNASHHFRVLRESGILRRSQRGSQQYAALRVKELEDRPPGLLSSVLPTSTSTLLGTSDPRKP